ncbi:hypothetical protein ACFQ0B_79670 [Nonomuraea thailandensis]
MLRLIRMVCSVIAAVLVVTQLLVVPPAGAQAGGPSVELPELASVAVTQQTMGERQPDQASRQALRVTSRRPAIRSTVRG